MNEILLAATIIAPIATGLTQVVKKATNVSDRYIPFIAVILGMVLGGLAMFLDLEIGIRIWAGLIGGLASVGLFEGIDKAVKPTDSGTHPL